MKRNMRRRGGGLGKRKTELTVKPGVRMMLEEEDSSRE